MVKYFVMCLTGFLLIGFVNCSDNEFSQVDQTGNVQGTGGTCNDAHCDTYNVTQNANNPAQNKATDILFVFDNSGTMVDENQKLKDRMAGFISGLNANGVDYNICYTLSEPSVHQQGRVSKWTNNNYVLNKNTPNLNSVFLNTLDNVKNTPPTFDQPEQPIAGTTYMIEGNLNGDCFRNNTAVNVVFLTDEDENDDGTNLGYRNQPASLVNIAKTRFGEVPFMVHTIIAYENFACYTSEGNEKANTHYSLAQMTGGIVGDICSNDYASQLSDISIKIQDTLDSVALECTPIGEVTITSTNNISYQYTIENRRLFLNPGIPGDSSVTISYDCKKAK